MDTKPLLDSWLQLSKRVGLPPAPDLGADLVSSYSQPHRVFHTCEHLAHVTGLLESAGADDRLVLAAWFHDAVYRPGSTRNEARSARLAQNRLARLGYPQSDIRFVSEAISATASHQCSHDAFAPLLDADLAILGSTPEVYDRYATAIGEEFSHVPTFLFHRARARFLQSMLDRPAIYTLPLFRERFESSARGNLARELHGHRTPE
jgi:predicted metal-dependent HD superfamily phosphohydrolase